MYEPPSLAHQGVDFDNPAAAGGQAALRPSVGLAGYPSQAFNTDASLSLFSDDAALYRSLKRTRQQSIVAVVILGVLLVLVSVLYYTKDASVVLPDNLQSELHEFNNHTDLINLDLDANNNHGVCMSRADQGYFLFMNGVLVAQGSDNCGLELVDKQIRAPECRQNMHGQEMWVAIEAQDSEAMGSIGTNLGGIKASMEWCGLEITTRGSTTGEPGWRCSTTAEPGWQNPLRPLPDVPADPFSITWDEDAEGNDQWGEPAAVLDKTKVEQQADGPIRWLGSGPEYREEPLEAQWIWMDGKSVAGHTNTESADSVYCRRKVSCHDPEFSDQIQHTGYRCESAFVNQTEVQQEAVGCEHEVEKDEGEEAECVVGLMASPANFAKGIGGCMLMIYMFVGFHIVCDDFFVPALNVLCDKLNMPDDIAGATFMAAGASSPELFASLIGVLTHSAVGAGTVVGSELFNMLVIIGGVCLVTPSALTLDWRPLAREVIFFSLSLVGILLTLSDSVVYLYEAILLMGGYVLYVVVCANFNKLVRMMCPVSSAEDEAISSQGKEDLNGFVLEDGLTEADIRESVNYSADQLNGKAFGMDYGQVFMHGFMFKKSEFYTKVRNSKQMWQKRWLVLNEEVGLYYTKKNGKDRVLLSLPASWSGTSIQKLSYTEFALKTPGNTLVFKAGKPAFCKAWIRAIESRIQHFQTLSPGSMATAPMDGEDVEDFSEEEAHDILSMPESMGARIFFIYCFPLLALFKYTILDVRKKKWTNCYPVTMATTVVWLAFMAEGMMTGAETAGCIMEIPQDVMGLTIAAAGTSLPNLFASLIVAKQGLGNMSVSNAFGSNTFNIFIALALPWAVGAFLQGTSHDPCGIGYAYLVPAGKIFTSCMILVAVLVMIVGCLAVFNMQLTREVGYFFNVCYLVILGYLLLA